MPHRPRGQQGDRDVLDLRSLAVPPLTPWLPESVWRVVRIPLTRSAVWLTVGLYDPPVRELLGPLRNLPPPDRRDLPQHYNPLRATAPGLAEK